MPPFSLGAGSIACDHVLTNLAKNLALIVSRDSGPLQLRNGPESRDLERRSESARVVSATPIGCA
jgi:hypothetical protein